MKSETYICPICGTGNFEDISQNPHEVMFDCGNIISINETSQESSDTCSNKIEWDKVLVPYGDEFDESAKLIDDRFFGWIELQFYKSYHQEGWQNHNFGNTCTDKKFVDRYFDNKEIYLRDVRKMNSSPLYVTPGGQVIEKEYVGDFWLGKVSVQEVYKFVEDGFETIIYKVVASEDDPLIIGGYVVEKNQLGGGDCQRDFYERKILDIIIRKEMKS
ncbi:MAG: hypothetical protein AABY15_07125 [Nanoarchaeota archaeon]